MTENKTCLLCKSSVDDRLIFGGMITKEDITVHQFCLLLAPNLQQNGYDLDESFAGFLKEDIVREAKRVRALRCVFCKKKSANLGCFERTCPKSYHTFCGYQKNVNFQFSSNFPSYCSTHATKKIKTLKPNKGVDSTCRICFLKVNKENRMLSPCCLNGYFHKKCLQKFAFSAGAGSFRCPLCANEEKFRGNLQLNGIFIPIQEASWEVDSFFEEPENYPVLLCEAEDCPDVQKDYESQHLWKLCCYCGAGCIHIDCFKKPYESDFMCKECKKILLPDEKDADTEELATNPPDVQKKPFCFPHEELVPTDDESRPSTSREHSLKKSPSCTSIASTESSIIDLNEAFCIPLNESSNCDNKENILNGKLSKKRSIVSSSDESSDEDENKLKNLPAKRKYFLRSIS